MFAKYFEYYNIILRGQFFRGHAKEIRESFYSNAAHIQAVHKLSVCPSLSSPVFSVNASSVNRLLHTSITFTGQLRQISDWLKKYH